MNSKNIFKNAETRRVREQKAIETTILSDAGTGARQDQEKRTTMSIAMSVKEKTMLKQYAVAQGKTAASIVQGWIKEFCGNN